MKKYNIKLILIFLITLCFITIFPKISWADYPCSWRQTTTPIKDGENPCSYTNVIINENGSAGGFENVEGILSEGFLEDCGPMPSSPHTISYCCCPPEYNPKSKFDSLDLEALKKTDDLNPLGNMQVKIPGLDKLAEQYPIECEENDLGAKVCKIPWIPIYIYAIYNYFLSIGGILAAIALMIGGVIWLVSAGNASRVSEAKSWITGSVTGLIILLTSYVLLYQINPELIGMRYVELESIDPIAGDTITPSNNGWEGAPFSSNATAEHLTKIDIYCPKSGGSAEIKKIAESFRGKMVYRLGSKNGKGDEHNKAKAQEKYGLSCPNNEKWGEPVVCYDCSGFVRQVLWCAGFTKDPGAGTGVIFPGTEKISTCGTVGGKPSINGKILIEGDLVGWYPKGDGSNTSGHVLIYIGNGKLADAHGTRSYPPAGAYGEFSLCTEVKKRAIQLKKTDRSIYIKRIGSY